MWEVLHADGLAVGPVEVIAHSGSNVDIRNVFNIYLVGDGFSKDALEFVASDSDEEGGQPAREKRGPLIILRRHKRSSSSTSRPALESSTAVTGTMAAEADEVKQKEKEEVKPTALRQETSSTAAPTEKPPTRASTAATQKASTAAVRVSSRKSSSAPTSTSRTATRTTPGGRIYHVNLNQTRDRRIPSSKSTATSARSSPTSGQRRSLDGSAEIVDLSPEAVADQQPRAGRSTASTPALKRGMRSAAAEAATGFSGDASVEAVDRSPEALPEQPTQSRQARHIRGQQGDADSEAFVPEHVALSDEDGWAVSARTSASASAFAAVVCNCFSAPIDNRNLLGVDWNILTE